MMNLRQLEYFYYVAKYKGFTNASRQVPFSIGQPALSIRVKELESSLGIKLYQIVGRRFQVTPSGEYLFNAIAPFFESLDSTERHLRAEAHGHLIFAEASPMLILHEHKDILVQFRRRYPGVQISILEKNWTDLLQSVIEGEVDLAFGSAPELVENVTFEIWGEAEYLLLCPPDHPLAKKSNIQLAEISGYPLILLEKGTADRQHIENTFHREKLFIDVVIDSSSYTLINDAVSEGMGVAIVNALWPRPAGSFQPRAIGVSHLFGQKHIGLFQRTDRYLPPYAHEYLSMLRGPVINRMDGR